VRIFDKGIEVPGDPPDIFGETGVGWFMGPQETARPWDELIAGYMTHSAWRESNQRAVVCCYNLEAVGARKRNYPAARYSLVLFLFPDGGPMPTLKSCCRQKGEVEVQWHGTEPWVAETLTAHAAYLVAEGEIETAPPGADLAAIWQDYVESNIASFKASGWKTEREMWEVQ
jgi:hypothetical protein